MRLDTKTAFITGAGSGLGREAARLFASEGATIVAADVDADGVAQTVEMVEAEGGVATAHELDVRDADAVEAAIDATVEEYGLDVVLNNAGISEGGGQVDDVDLDTLQKLIDVNAKGVWHGTRAAAPHFREQGSGAIVNTASIAGLIGAPYLSGYSLSKGAVVTFTKAMAKELGPHGVRVNAVCPGVTITPMLGGDEDRSAEEAEAAREEMVQDYPLRRLGRPADVANAMLFLASDEADWITGQALAVDGGYTCA